MSTDTVELLRKLLAHGAVELQGEARIEPYAIWHLRHTDTSRGGGTPEYREIVTTYSGRDLVQVLQDAVKKICREPRQAARRGRRRRAGEGGDL